MLDNIDWMSLGNCYRKPHLQSFFFSDGIIRQERAKVICSTCPVRSDCLDFAIENEQQGIWGGTTEDERRVKATARRLLEYKALGLRSSRQHALKHLPSEHRVSSPSTSYSQTHNQQALLPVLEVQEFYFEFHIEF